MHDKDETMHLGVKNNTNLDDNKKKNEIQSRDHLRLKIKKD